MHRAPQIRLATKFVRYAPAAFKAKCNDVSYGAAEGEPRLKWYSAAASVKCMERKCRPQACWQAQERIRGPQRFSRGTHRKRDGPQRARFVLVFDAGHHAPTSPRAFHYQLGYKISPTNAVAGYSRVL